MVRSEWFSFGRAQFLIRALNPGQILCAQDLIKQGKMSEGEALEKVFGSVLVDFRQIGGGKGISRTKKISVLFGDSEVRNFVFKQAADLLEREISVLKRIGDTLERFLFLSGKLKS